MHKLSQETSVKSPYPFFQIRENGIGGALHNNNAENGNGTYSNGTHGNGNYTNGYGHGHVGTMRRPLNPTPRPTRSSTAIPQAEDRYYSSPYSHARPNHYYVPTKATTHNAVLSRRMYVRDVGGVHGHQCFMGRMQMYQSYIDHRFITQRYYYGYGPGYQTCPM